MTNKMKFGTVRLAVVGSYARHLYIINSKAMVLRYLNARRPKFGSDTTTNDFWRKV